MLGINNQMEFSNLCRASINEIDSRHNSIIDFILDVLKKLASRERDSVTVSQIYESMNANNDPFGGYEFAKNLFEKAGCSDQTPVS